jgi:TPP-dependent 2-oxoacid decarboxylase
VGAFSALNGVAGANAERLPVIFVSAGYNTFEKIRCAAVRILHADNAPSLIDEAIGTALRERKPAYIEIDCNLANAPCPEPAPFETLVTAETSNRLALDAAVERASALLANAKKPVLLAGPHLRPSGAIHAFRGVAEALGCAVAVRNTRMSG